MYVYLFSSDEKNKQTNNGIKINLGRIKGKPNTVKAMPAYNGNADWTIYTVQNKTDAKDIISNKMSTQDLGQNF